MTTKPGPMKMFLGRTRKAISLFENVSKAYLHSDRSLEALTYKWAGCVPAQDISRNDVPVSVDAKAYCQRSQKDGRVVKLRTGTYSPQHYPLKLFGVVRGDQLFLILKQAGEAVRDIADLAPMRTSGVKQVIRMFNTITSKNAQQELPGI